jgi:hypothetical protein
LFLFVLPIYFPLAHKFDISIDWALDCSFTSCPTLLQGYGPACIHGQSLVGFIGSPGRNKRIARHSSTYTLCYSRPSYRLSSMYFIDRRAVKTGGTGQKGCPVGGLGWPVVVCDGILWPSCRVVDRPSANDRIYS